MHGQYIFLGLYIHFSPLLRRFNPAEPVNHVNNLKKHAKEQFYFNVNTLLDDFSSSNSKSYWSLIKKLVKSSGDMSPISQLKKENNDLISDDYEKAYLLRERPFNLKGGWGRGLWFFSKKIF